MVLAKAKQERLAREELAACLKVADEGKLRSLSPGSLYRLLVLTRLFDMPLKSPLRESALGLLPVDQRERLK